MDNADPELGADIISVSNLLRGQGRQGRLDGELDL